MTLSQLGSIAVLPDKKKKKNIVNRRGDVLANALYEPETE